MHSAAENFGKDRDGITKKKKNRELRGKTSTATCQALVQVMQNARSMSALMMMINEHRGEKSCENPTH